MATAGLALKGDMESVFGDLATAELTNLRIIENTPGTPIPPLLAPFTRQPSTIISYGQTLQLAVDVEYGGAWYPALGIEELEARFFIEGLGQSKEIDVLASPVYSAINLAAGLNRITLLSDVLTASPPTVPPAPNNLPEGLYRAGVIVTDRPDPGPAGVPGGGPVVMGGFVEGLVFKVREAP